MNKVNFKVNLVVELEENINIDYLDDILKSKLSERGLDLAFGYGGADYVLILKDKISDKQ